ncbi:hypothetical protein ACFONL_08075 [Camelimonas fluminis]|uniref:Uncharacterized protein n=1 Tax=Camelimonas fluminis TaxID=1576911 RepID=A0ABV7UFZ3_9HYPH
MPVTIPAERQQGAPLAQSGTAALPALLSPRADMRDPAPSSQAASTLFDPAGIWAYPIDAWQRSVLLRVPRDGGH